MDEIARVVRKVVQRVASTTRLEWPSSYEHIPAPPPPPFDDATAEMVHVERNEEVDA
jgi:hypothetical protein